ncbi:hypothetical protein NB231_12776 [Nitrococcus mobilis Nb-231]|uniref:Uncharacterized protein n=1 Tax=Nitrococcus mobilis Nb-231 TaxID=314278 RepID=A4BU90_9GAMM|nr:hypothetical protein NB231_12776 [Nitrococcus mobilis Nb-231]
MKQCIEMLAESPRMGRAADAIRPDARQQHPASCWSGKSRNWEPIRVISLNSQRESKVTPAKPEKHVA